MTDFYPAHGDERCCRCGDDIGVWYCVLPLGPGVVEVCCPLCFVIATEPA